MAGLTWLGVLPREDRWSYLAEAIREGLGAYIGARERREQRELERARIRPWERQFELEERKIAAEERRETVRALLESDEQVFRRLHAELEAIDWDKRLPFLRERAPMLDATYIGREWQRQFGERFSDMYIRAYEATQDPPKIGWWQRLFGGERVTPPPFPPPAPTAPTVTPPAPAAIADYYVPPPAPRRRRGRIRVRLKATGQTGTIEEHEFDPAIYERF